MANENNKNSQTVKTVKLLKICSIAASFLTALLVIIQLFSPALNVGEQSGTEYVYKTYSGIESAFFCWPEFILGGQLMGPNPVYVFGFAVAILVGIVGAILQIRALKKKAAIVGGISCAVFFYMGITWLMLPNLVMISAYDKFKDIVYYAKENGMYGIHPFAVFVAVVAIVSAVVNAVYAVMRNNAEEFVEARERKPMTLKKAIAFSGTVMALTLALITTATVVMNYYSGVMNNFFGQAKAKSSSDGDASSKYYDGILDEENYSTKEGSKAFAEKANEQIVSEGVVLLKNENNTLPLKASSGITLLGAGFNLKDALEAQGFSVLDKTIENPPANGLTENGWSQGDFKGYDDAAIVTFYRNYGEGADAQVVGPDGVRTELSLSEAELELLDNACHNFRNVIVMIASSNAMETSFITAGSNYVDNYYNTDTTYDFGNIKGAMWLSSRIGDNGPAAVAKLLSGEINPSGRTVDTFVKDLRNDPTFNNNGDFIYTNGDLGTDGYRNNPYTPVMDGYTSTTFVEYEEGIYSGYRYYETAAYESANGNYEGFDYDEQVVFPFGYGLSYTTFDMEYDGEPVFDEASGKYTFNVKVTNTGNVAGKQVVEIFLNAPYTGSVEKAQVTLAGFAKTKTLEAGESEVVTIEVDQNYITSYDYKNAGCYVLEAGDYNFYLSENSHSWTSIDTADASKCWTWNLGETVTFDENNKRTNDVVAATNQMDDLTNWKFTDEPGVGTGFAVNMSRSNFAATYPTAPEGNDFVAQDRILEERKKFDPETVDTTVEEIVLTDFTATEIKLADLRGVDYDDPMWTDYIQQFSLDKLVEMYSNGNWQEVADEENGVPRTVDLDGPQGLTAQALDTMQCQVYQGNILIGATWNRDMADLMGEAIANEMLAYGWTGWYGPGMNIHRSQFCGRNIEYYSEDPMLSGIMGSVEVAAASEGGVICFNKHFAVNNQETNRQGNICTWVNEQAMREVYLRAWEYYVKETKMNVLYYKTDEDGNMTLSSKEMPGATGIMTSYNLIGAKWAGACEEVTVNILRGEFGYKGIALTDAINNATEYMDPTAGMYSGASDICLSQVVVNDYDNDYATVKLQNAVKNILYAKANSNCLQLNGLVPGASVSYGIAPWQVGLIIGWIVVAAIWAACIVMIIRIRNRCVIHIEEKESK